MNDKGEPRICKKCKKIVPNRITIDGKIHNLQNRKFCLECSPYGSHNTKKDDPSKPSVKKGRYSEWTKEYKEKHSNCCKHNQYRRAINKKDEFIERAGGSCCICNYKKCTDALVFHHVDPSQKKFSLTLSNLWSHSNEKLEEEFKKCKLYCLICHAELHREERDKNPNSIRNKLK